MRTINLLAASTLAVLLTGVSSAALAQATGNEVEEVVVSARRN